MRTISQLERSLKRLHAKHSLAHKELMKVDKKIRAIEKQIAERCRHTNAHEYGHYANHETKEGWIITALICDRCGLKEYYK